MANETTTSSSERINWYRSPVSREDLAALNARSDWKGFRQAGGHLGLLMLTGSAAYLSAGRLWWPLVILLFFFHGMCYCFLINGFHELAHDSVFKTKRLNQFFLCIYNFLGWYNHVLFWASHQEHHKYTLHPPRDLEVVLPTDLTLKGFCYTAIIEPTNFYYAVRQTIQFCRGQLKGEWENHLFPESNPKQRRRLFNCSRFVLAGHVTIVAVSLALGLWLLPLLITCGRFYGSWLFYLCNNTQHVGLQDKVPDFRLCCRTVILSPFPRFLYWQMNYHTEHHMYAAVPCYNLGKLHKLVKEDLPHCPHGLIEAWSQIIAILKRQKTDPEYQFVAELPKPG